VTTSQDSSPDSTHLVERIRDHLERSGWQLVDEDLRTTMWRSVRRAAGEQSDVIVILPTSAAFADARYFGDAVRAIAYVEDRSVTEVTTDLGVEGGADTVSLRLTPDAPSGSAPLESVQAAVNSLHDLVVGACAGLVLRDLVLPARRPQRAERYAARTLVSTEAGSFIVNLALPRIESATLPESTATTAEPTLIDLSPQPYGRRVLDRLRQVTQRSVVLAGSVGDGDSFIRDFGIPGPAAANATELAALAGLGGTDHARYQLRFSQAPDVGDWERPLTVVVTPAQQAVLADAAAFLREKQPRTGVTVTGLVVRLSRVNHLGPGEVTVRGESDDSGAQRRFRMELGEGEYAEAMRAHQVGLFVLATGDVELAGTQATLRRMTEFAVLPGLED
jgi:hypothetical protein